MSQRDTVRSYLLEGNVLTAKDAFELFGIQRLSSIIFELRKEFHINATYNSRHVEYKAHQHLDK